jgi:hypothetical protein
MTDVEDIGQAISRLSEDDLARLRDWFAAFDADKFDARIEADGQSGRLDALADLALADWRLGRAKDL